MRQVRAVTLLSLVLAPLILSMDMAARASAPSYPSIPVICSQLNLQLEPGVRRPDWSLEPTVSIPKGWPPLPLDPVDLPAPLYPNAVQSSRKPSVAFYSHPASAYEKTAVAESTIPASVSSGLAWYAKAFAACGYQEVNHGNVSDNGIAADGIAYKSSTFPNLYISVSLQQLSSSQSLLLYYGAAVSLPQRPQDTYLPSNEQRVRITYIFPDSKHEWRLSITNPQVLGTLADAINSGAGWGLPKPPDYVKHTCFSPSNRGGAVLDFASSSGKHKVVVVDYGCRSFGIAGPNKQVQDYNKVSDYDRAVWYTVSYVAYRFCLSHRCKKVRT